MTAILVALALVVGAAYLRSVLHDDQADGNATNHGSGTPVVACTPDLQPVCDALAAKGAIAAHTPTLDLDRASDPAAIKDLDGWITWDPAPGIADADATDRAWDQPLVMGSAPMVLLVADNARPASCRAKVTWGCLAGSAPTETAIGLGDPRAAEGIVRIAPVATELSTDRDYTTLNSNKLQALLSGPLVAVGEDAMAQGTALITQNGSLAGVVGPKLLMDRLASGPRAGRATSEPVTPRFDATVVLAPRAGGDGIGNLGDCSGRAAADAALRGAGVEPCTGKLAADDLAGFLYQVRKKVG
ncbi:MAG: hypothetical protein JWM89_2732 [Acidimicrobiales bacterium]|nr:hypothetical protein [Acidimicrobiales bacterium]